MSIEKTFLLQFDELNPLLAATYADSKTKAEVVGNIESVLINAYVAATEAACEELEEDIALDTEKMFAAIDKVIDGKTYKDRVSEYFEASDFPAITKVAETEMHRVFNQAICDIVERSENSADIKKTWVTMKDEKVRDTHFYLEGVTIPFNEEFVTFDGDSASAPGLFSFPENVVNCRCTLKIGK